MYHGFYTLRGRKFPYGNFRTSVFCKVKTQIVGKTKFFDRLGEVRLSLAPENGAGRTVRYAAVHAKEMCILADASSLEIFVNHGETVLTTRCYPDPASRGVRLSGGTASLRSMNRMEYSDGISP